LRPQRRLAVGGKIENLTYARRSSHFDKFSYEIFRVDEAAFRKKIVVDIFNLRRLQKEDLVASTVALLLLDLLDHHAAHGRTKETAAAGKG
jgi:hypothetical protein